MRARMILPVVLLIGVLLPVPPPAWAAADTKPGNTRPVAIDPTKLAEYAGVYPLDAHRRYTVVVDPDGGGLRIRLTGQPFFPYAYVGDDAFYSRGFAARFTFQRGADGRVEHVTMKRDWIEMTGRRSGDAPAVRFLTPAQIQAYLGTYEWAPGAGLAITAKDDQLYAQLVGQPALSVYADRVDHFVYEVINAALTFERDAAGNLVSLTLDQGTRFTRATKVASPATAAAGDVRSGR